MSNMFKNQLNLLRNVARNISRSIPVNKNHYDSLGLSPKATQAEVKAAYYKLSMVYHPDKNKGSEEAGQKFRDVAEAYEVLGNVRLRRLYDRGVDSVGGNNLMHPEADDDPSTRFYRSREVRHRPPPPSGNTPIYDFDEWSRSHYGATFKKDMDIKNKRVYRQQQNDNDKNEVKTERLLVAMGAMIFLFAYLSLDARNNDKTLYTRSSDNAIPSSLNEK